MPASKANPWVGDIREETYNERLKIGYDNVRNNWQNAPAYFDEFNLKICGHPVMETWEDEYMKMLADIATLRKGVVLEVGFGMGISAGYIQNRDIEKHIIIEANKQVLEQSKKFLLKAEKPIQFILGFWEDVITEIVDSSISGILFDTYPLSQEEVHKNHFSFFKEAFRILKPGGILTYYSDEVNTFSACHLAALREAGFFDINSQVCPVSPPPDCQYWKSATILAPIIIK
jgi:guanidinoacetate N-methyltransferase